MKHSTSQRAAQDFTDLVESLANSGMEGGYHRSSQLDSLLQELDCSPKDLPSTQIRAAVFSCPAEAREFADESKQLFLRLDQPKPFSLYKDRGYGLSHQEERVWMQILESASKTPLGGAVEVSSENLCAALNCPHTEENREGLVSSALSDLQRRGFTLRTPNQSMSLALISKYQAWHSETSSQYAFQLDIIEVALLAGDRFDVTNWMAYQGLPWMAQRLADYAFSERDPAPLPLSDFAALVKETGGESSRSAATRACNALQASGLVASATIQRSGAIHLERRSGLRPVLLEKRKDRQ